MKGFKIKPPKYIVDFEKKHKIIGYVWEYVRDKYHNIISSRRTHGITESGEKFPFPRNEAVEKAILDAKKIIKLHFLEDKALKEIHVPKNQSDPRFNEILGKRNKAEIKANKTATNAREAIKAVEEAEKEVKKAIKK